MSDHIVNDPFGPDAVAGTPIEWFQSRMAASGIKQNVANKCGFQLRIGDDGAFFTIPYFDVDGIQTTYSRQRNRDEQNVREPDHSSGGHKGKYTQPKGSKNHIYWPPLGPLRTYFNSPAYPLIVCEGELKAVRCQMALAESGIEALVLGFPGTILCKQLEMELRAINCADPKAPRLVYLSLDWNAKGKSREAALELEFKLTTLFQSLGSKVILLRWTAPEGAGEQKLDDWLVSGGDLGEAIAFSTESALAIDTEYSEIWQYLNANYAICHGYYIPLSNMKQKYNITALETMEPSKRIQISAKQFLGPTKVWGLQAPQDRNVVDGYVFKPAPLGLNPERYVWEDGVRLLNTAPPAVQMPAPWGDVDASPFLNLVRRLCGDTSDWFIQFLAHCAQRPLERGSHIIIFKDEGGTGKSRLFETLDLVFGKYSGPIGNCLTSSFNAELEHLLIAWWSDPVIHGGFDRDLESALKNFSGDSKITINHKAGAKYTVRNYGRLIIATNKDWIVPVSTKERRFTVFGGQAPLGHTEAGEYMRWLAEGGVGEIRRLLTELDLSEFDIQAPGPRTAQRLEMERASAPPVAQMLNCEILQVRDVWTIEQLRLIYKDQTGRNISDTALAIELSKLGSIKKVVKIDGKAVRLNAIRNAPQWDDAQGVEWAEEYKRS